MNVAKEKITASKSRS